MCHISKGTITSFSPSTGQPPSFMAIHLLTLCRYERKKRIDIAIDAFAHFKSLQGTSEQKSVLVVAGGYDERVDENVQYLQELRAHCKSIGFSQVPGQFDIYRCRDQMGQYDVIFRVSISGAERLALLTVAQGKPLPHALGM